MAKGELSCHCGHSRAALEVLFNHRRVGFLCSRCATDLYALRAFIVAGLWLYKGKAVEFVPIGPGAVEPCASRLAAVADFELRRFRESQEDLRITAFNDALTDPVR